MSDTKQKITSRFNQLNSEVKTTSKQLVQSRSYKDFAAFLLALANATITYLTIITIFIVILFMFEAKVLNNDIVLKIYVNAIVTVFLGYVLWINVKIAGLQTNRLFGWTGAAATLTFFITMSIFIWSDFHLTDDLLGKTLWSSASVGFLYALGSAFLLANYWPKYESIGKRMVKASALITSVLAVIIVVLGGTDGFKNDQLIYDLARGLMIGLSLLVGSGLLGLTTILIRKEGYEEISWRRLTTLVLGSFVIVATGASLFTFIFEQYDWIRNVFTEKMLATTSVIVIAGLGFGVASPSLLKRKIHLKVLGIITSLAVLGCAIFSLNEIYAWELYKHIAILDDVVFHCFLLAFHGTFLCLVSLIPTIKNSDRQAAKFKLCWGASIASVMLWEGLIEFQLFDFSPVSVGLVVITKILMIYGIIKAFLIYRRDRLEQDK